MLPGSDPNCFLFIAADRVHARKRVQVSLEQLGVDPALQEVPASSVRLPAVLHSPVNLVSVC